MRERGQKVNGSRESVARVDIERFDICQSLRGAWNNGKDCNSITCKVTISLTFVITVIFLYTLPIIKVWRY